MGGLWSEGHQQHKRSKLEGCWPRGHRHPRMHDDHATYRGGRVLFEPRLPPSPPKPSQHSWVAMQVCEWVFVATRSVSGRVSGSGGLPCSFFHVKQQGAAGLCGLVNRSEVVYAVAAPANLTRVWNVDPLLGERRYQDCAHRAT
jgi:hypothetical protein